MTRSCRRAHSLACALAFAFAVAPATGAAPPSENLVDLLRKLSEHSARLKEMQRSAELTLTTRSDQLDGKGRVESQMEIVERVFFRDGSEVRELIRFSKDGRDVTADERKKRAKKGDAGSSSLQLTLTSPFGTEEAAKYRFALLPPDASYPNLTRIHFEPAGEASPAVNVGDAFVDAAAGSPVRIRCRPSANPKHVSRMDIEMRFDASTSDGPALSAVTIEGEGGILFIKKGFRMTVSFSGYTPPSAP